MNISTAEDPVEFNLHGINQVQMHEEIGLTFASCFEIVSQQDPDIIMVGEIRDFETAEIAVKAALTGHMVLSTLHTNDAPQTINRSPEHGCGTVSRGQFGELHRRPEAGPKNLPPMQGGDRSSS